MLTRLTVEVLTEFAVIQAGQLEVSGRWILKSKIKDYHEVVAMRKIKDIECRKQYKEGNG